MKRLANFVHFQFGLGTRRYSNGSSFGKFDWKDPLKIEQQLTEEELLVM
jgi:hypothetical protein